MSMSMKEVSEHYTSLEDMRAAWGLKPVSKQTSDQKKLDSQKEKFCSKHICKACGQPMTYVKGTNTMCCANEKCKGFKHERKNEKTGETTVYYTTSFHTLNEKSAIIASNIFE